jgi:hypothetical protein
LIGTLRTGDKTEFADIVFHRVAGNTPDNVNDAGEMSFNRTIKRIIKPAIAMSVAVETMDAHLLPDRLPVWSEFIHQIFSGGGAFFDRFNDLDDKRVISVKRAGKVISFMTHEIGVLVIAGAADGLSEQRDIFIDRCRFDGKDGAYDIRQEAPERALFACRKAAGAATVAVKTAAANPGLELGPILVYLHCSSLLTLMKERSADKVSLTLSVKTRSDLIKNVEFCPERFFSFFEQFD